MRILSRVNGDEAELDRLREILEAATGGDISPGGIVEPGSTLSDLVTQVDNTIVNYMKANDGLEYAYDIAHRDASVLAVQCAMQEELIESITAVGFDEALDDATIDLMDALLGSGAATSTFDGDISFDSDISFTKQDLKPFLRQAITTWISTKVR